MGFISEAATDSVPATFILRNPGGVELSGSESDFVTAANVIPEAGIYFSEIDVGTEAEIVGSTLTFDLDIGNDGEIDCEADAVVSSIP